MKPSTSATATLPLAGLLALVLVALAAAPAAAQNCTVMVGSGVCCCAFVVHREEAGVLGPQPR
jgi:hypothetical protein